MSRQAVSKHPILLSRDGASNPPLKEFVFRKRQNPASSSNAFVAACSSVQWVWRPWLNSPTLLLYCFPPFLFFIFFKHFSPTPSVHQAAIKDYAISFFPVDFVTGLWPIALVEQEEEQKKKRSPKLKSQSVVRHRCIDSVDRVKKFWEDIA